MKKAVLTLALGVAAAVLCGCGFTACSSGKGSEGLVYENTADGELVVTGYTGSAKRVKVPNVYANKPVREIADGAFAESSITSISLPPTITKVGANAFAKCGKLERIAHATALKEIGENAFYECYKLEKIEWEGGEDFPQKIGAKAFYGCSSLMELPFESPTGENSNSDVYIGDEAFANCRSLSTATLPRSIAYMGKDVFANCDKMQYTIKDGLQYLGNSKNAYLCLMGGNSELTSVTLDNECYVEAKAALEDCTNIAEITMPRANTFLGHMFGATEVAENGAFVPESLKKITIKSLRTPYAFAGCSNITDVVMEDCWSIPTYAFVDCTSLKNITLSKELTSIGSSAFQNCSSLTSLTIPERVAEIGSSVLSGCTGLTQLTIPFVGNSASNGGTFRYWFGENSATPPNLKTVTVLGGKLNKDAFANCPHIQTLTLGMKDYKYSAFTGCSALKELRFTANATNIWAGVLDGCTNVSNIVVDTANPEYQSIDGNLYTKNGSSLIRYAAGKTQTSFTVPSSTTGVWQGAFEGSKFLQTVGLPSSTKSIGNRLFKDCSALKTITMSQPIVSVGDEAFSGCSNLQSVVISDELTTIGVDAFKGCTSLAYNVYDNVNYLGGSVNRYIAAIGLANTNSSASQLHPSTKMIAIGAFADTTTISNLSLPDGLLAIGENAFENSKIQTISIPDSVTGLGTSAFKNCSALTDVTMGAGITVIGKNMFEGCSSLKNVTCKGAVTEIHTVAFKNCTALEQFTIPSGVKSIGFGAFLNCTALQEIVIPSGVEAIWGSAFDGCSSLAKVFIPKSVTTINDYVFSGCSDELIIYCEANLPNSKWNNGWNRKTAYSNESYYVVWGYTQA